MAVYRIIRRNSVYKGAPGDEIVAVPGRLLNAAVRAGLITRTDIEEAATPAEELSEETGEEEPEPSKPKKRGRNG